MMADFWEGAVCGSVFGVLEGRRMPCTLGPLKFVNSLIPNARDQTGDKYQNEDEDDDDSETEGGAKKKRKKPHMNPIFAEADHSHVELTRYAKLVAKAIGHGWLPALIYKEKTFNAMCHLLFSFDKPEDINADFVRGLGEVFLTTAPVQLKHHVCHNADRHHGDTPFPHVKNLLGFSSAQARSWLQPLWIVPYEPSRPAFKTRRPRHLLGA
jgi:hypothetical protein